VGLALHKTWKKKGTPKDVFPDRQKNIVKPGQIQGKGSELMQKPREAVRQKRRCIPAKKKNRHDKKNLQRGGPHPDERKTR